LLLAGLFLLGGHSVFLRITWCVCGRSTRRHGHCRRMPSELEIAIIR
jgi:hypothetical protein